MKRSLPYGCWQNLSGSQITTIAVFACLLKTVEANGNACGEKLDRDFLWIFPLVTVLLAVAIVALAHHQVKQLRAHRVAPAMPPPGRAPKETIGEDEQNAIASDTAVARPALAQQESSAATGGDTPTPATSRGDHSPTGYNDATLPSSTAATSTQLLNSNPTTDTTPAVMASAAQQGHLRRQSTSASSHSSGENDGAADAKD
eukprot:m.74054 g.74054  ORF g.74054 m.74054 type:complete len:202 (+) comp16142_c0_seq4:64-669(+)